MTLAELYAERDLLRSRRTALESKIESLVPLETKNRIAINRLEQNYRKNERPATFEKDYWPESDAADFPEFFNVRTVD